MTRVTLARVKRIVLSNNNVANLKIEWVQKMKPRTGFNGYTYRSGRVKVSGDGYKPKTMTVSQDADSVMVR